MVRTIGAQELRSISLFAKLSQPQRKALASLLREKKYSPGEVFYKAQTTNRRIALVTSGQFDCYFEDESAPLNIFSVSTGMAWGYETLIRPSHRYPYTVVASGKHCTVLEIETTKFFKLFAADPELKHHLVEAVCEQLASTSEKNIELLATAGIIQKLLISDNKREIIIDQVLGTVARAVRARRALLARFDDTSKAIFIEGSAGFRPTLAGTAYSLAGDTLLSLVYNTQQAISITPDTFERKFASAAYSSQNFMAVPIMSSTLCIGALALSNNQDRKHFSSQDELFLTITATMIGGFLSGLQHDVNRSYQEYVKRTYIISHSRF